MRWIRTDFRCKLHLLLDNIFSKMKWMLTIFVFLILGQSWGTTLPAPLSTACRIEGKIKGFLNRYTQLTKVEKDIEGFLIHVDSSVVISKSDPAYSPQVDCERLIGTDVKTWIADQRIKNYPKEKFKLDAGISGKINLGHVEIVDLKF